MLQTTQQFTTMKATILAEPAVAAYVAAGAHQEIADYYNVNHATMRVWRSRVLSEEVFSVVVWTELIARSVGERDTFRMMLDRGFFAFSNANIRGGVQDIFSGVGGQLSRLAIIAIGKRRASRAEAIFADVTSPNVGTIQDPALLVCEGPLLGNEVYEALSI